MAKGAYIGVPTKIYSNPTTAGSLAVGSIIQINEDGSPVDYIIIHQGNPDTSIYDSSCEGTWVLRKDVHSNQVWGTSPAKYSDSNIHTYLNSTFYNLFDENTKNAIKKIKIPYNSNIESFQAIGSDGLETNVFLLSIFEYLGQSDGFVKDGSILEYFNGADNAKRIAYLNGTAASWLSRSATHYYTNRITSVFTDGSATGFVVGSNATGGIRPAFILKSDTIIKNYICQLGEMPIGSTIKINEDGSPVEYIIVNQGNPDANFYDASCNGTWVLRKHAKSPSTQFGSSSQQYNTSVLHTYLTGTFLPLLDSNIQNVICNVKIPYVSGYDSDGTSIVSYGANGLSTKIFALSAEEVGSQGSMFSVDGVKLSYFMYNNIDAAVARRKTSLSGSTTVNVVKWWTRTKQKDYATHAVMVNANGYGDGEVSSLTAYIRPAFILPFNLIIENGVATGTLSTDPQVLGNVQVGSTIKINENGTPVDYIVVQQGNPDSTMYDKSCDGTWVLRKDIYEKRAWDSTNNDYANSDIHAYLNNTFLGLLDSSLLSKVKQVKIPYINGIGNSNSSSPAYRASGLSTKVFLLSASETNAEVSLFNIIGTCLSYFNDTSSLDEGKRIGYFGDTAYPWWLRSVSKSSIDYAAYIADSGRSNNISCTANYGVRPAFILPSTLSLTNNVVTGAEAPYTTKSVARKVKKGYIGINATFDRLGDMAVGSIVKLKENGEPVDYLIVHQGNPSTSLYDSSCNGTWVLRKDIYDIRTWDDSSNNDDIDYNNDYANSNIHTYLNNGFFSLFDSTTQATIKQVKIPYISGAGSSGVLVSGSNGLSTKVFLLGGYEYGVSTSDYSYLPVDGAKLDYFPSGITSDEIVIRIAKYNGVDTRWWLRTPRTYNEDNVFSDNTYGYLEWNHIKSSNVGTRPAMILNSDAGVYNSVIVSSTSGTQSVARRIKKAYIGIGGVARPCWSNGELAYYGTITPFSNTRYGLATTTVGNYALFGGGRISSSGSGAFSTGVDAYNKSLIRTQPTELSVTRRDFTATTVGNYALFGGGLTTSTKASNAVDAYDTSLTRTTPTALSAARYDLAATTVGNYALFGGGYTGNSYLGRVDAYDTSLTITRPTEMYRGRRHLAATTVGGYALFGGGIMSAVRNEVDAYDASLTLTTLDVLKTSRYSLAATTVGNYALFGGGRYETTYYGVVDAYDTSLTHTIPTALGTKRGNLAATTVDDYALFGGGYTGNASNVVDAYDTSLTRTTPTALSTARTLLGAATIGDYALFGGGQGGSDSKIYDIVDAYTLQ